MQSRKGLRIWRGGRIATLDARQPGVGLIERGAVVAQDRTILWVGEAADLPASLVARADDMTDLGGRLVTPGLIDCHTHLVFGADRAVEWGMRLSFEMWGRFKLQKHKDRTREGVYKLNFMKVESHRINLSRRKLVKQLNRLIDCS